MSLPEPDKMLWQSMTNLIGLVSMQVRSMALASEGNEDLTDIVNHRIGTLREVGNQIHEEAEALELLMNPGDDPMDLSRWTEGDK